jgi:hypothetical protein
VFLKRKNEGGYQEGTHHDGGDPSGVISEEVDHCLVPLQLDI